MNIPKTDLAVVGGGPAGLLSARKAAEEGNSVLLFDSKEKIGFHEHCAGLLSIQGLQDLDLTNLPSDVIQNDSIKGATIYSSSGKSFTVEKKQPTAYVVNRAKFDQYLYNLATDSSVDVQLSSRVVGLERNNNSLNLKLGKNSGYKQIVSSIAILAEGRFPKLNQQVGLPSPKRDRIVFTSMYIMKDLKNIDPNYVELYQDQQFAPGFFSWIIPIDGSTAKVGLASTEVPASYYLKRFIKEHPSAKLKLKDAKVIKKMNGAIPLSSYIKKTYTDNVLVVGDAAGQTKPTTGGGVIFGGIAAQFAGKIASDAIKQNRYDRRFLAQYPKLWKKELRFNLSIMKYVRNYLNILTDKEIDYLLQVLNKPRLKKKISEKGDVDNQKKIVYRLLSDFRLWPFFIKTGFKFLLS
ncbi:MAG: NAD(P)/FAD-dependent oxidoreductase [Candidatus Heimdallarchaeota archaeon]|nr:NAD(P)/FAD-dependent oxidoreductase [Candidatus Heimdallarchaeota archaeon]